MFAFLSYNTAVVLLGVTLLGAAAGLAGSYALLRRRALTGDALAHAALPGLCAAFFVVGERSLPALLLGALVSGIAGIGVLAALRRYSKVKQDAAIAIVLGVFFGVGVVFLSVIPRMQGSSAAGLESFILGKTAGMLLEDALLIAGLAAGVLVVVLVLFKEFKLVTFDPDFAGVQGWPTFALDFLLQILVVVVVIVGLPAVGVLLVAALLVIPPAAARFWTDRLGMFLTLSALFGGGAGAAGAWLSSQVRKLPAGPTITLCATGIFVVSVFLGVKKGVVCRWRRVKIEEPV